MRQRPNQKLKQKQRFKDYIENIEHRSKVKADTVMRGRIKILDLINRSSVLVFQK